MKRICIFVSMAAAMLFAGCTEEADSVRIPQGIELSPDANDTTFSVTGSGKWVMTVSDPWFKISPKYGIGDTDIRLVAERNATGQDRTSVLEFTCGGNVQRIEVRQPYYSADISIEAPSSVVMKKGNALTISVDSNTDDWEYALTDGAWLKEFRKNASELVFQVDPSVRYDESVPAVIEFTTPSDPAFYRKMEIMPERYFTFSAKAGDIFDLGAESQFSIDIETNIDWEYTVKNGAWLEEYSKVRNHLVFDGNAEKITDQSQKAEITFTNPDYANFSHTLYVQPVAPVTQQLVDKSKCKLIQLDNDFTPSGSEYLFDNAWCVNWQDYYAYKGGDPSAPAGYGYKSFANTAVVNNIGADAKVSFTIDVGSPVKLSKFITYFYYMYHANDPLQHEVYAWRGSGAPSGEWTSDWVKLGSVDASDAYAGLSTLATGTYCSRLANGEAVSVDRENAVEARYYRFKMVANGYRIFGMLAGSGGVDYANSYCWSRGAWMTISEVSLYEYIDN